LDQQLQEASAVVDLAGWHSDAIERALSLKARSRRELQADLLPVCMEIQQAIIIYK
jgi:hypothetical protein